MPSLLTDSLILLDILKQYEFVPRLKGYGFHSTAYVIVICRNTGKVLSNARTHEHGRAPHMKFNTANEAIEYVKENYYEIERTAKGRLK